VAYTPPSQRETCRWCSPLTTTSSGVSGERVVSFGHYAGTNKKTGKAFRVPFAHAWRMKDGKVTHFQQYTDTHVVQETMK